MEEISNPFEYFPIDADKQVLRKRKKELLTLVELNQDFMPLNVQDIEGMYAELLEPEKWALHRLVHENKQIKQFFEGKPTRATQVEIPKEIISECYDKVEKALSKQLRMFIEIQNWIEAKNWYQKACEYNFSHIIYRMRPILQELFDYICCFQPTSYNTSLCKVFFQKDFIDFLVLLPAEFTGELEKVAFHLDTICSFYNNRSRFLLSSKWLIRIIPLFSRCQFKSIWKDKAFAFMGYSIFPILWAASLIEKSIFLLARKIADSSLSV